MVLKERAAVTRCLELDPDLSEGHTQLAWLNMITGNWDLADIEHQFKLALESNPNNDNAHLRYGVYLLGVGKLEEAVWHTKQAQALDPNSLVNNSMVVRALYFAGQYVEAIEQGRKVIEMDKNFSMAYIFLGQSYEQKGMLTEAVPILEKANELTPGRNEYITALAHAYALSGKQGEAQKMLRAIPDSIDSEYAAAIIYTALGEKEKALTELERAYAARNPMILFRLKVDPRFDSIRSEPRFQSILQRVTQG